MLSTHIYSDNSLTCTIPVIPKCMTGNLPSPERVIQKLQDQSTQRRTRPPRMVGSRLSLPLASRDCSSFDRFRLVLGSVQLPPGSLLYDGHTDITYKSLMSRPASVHDLVLLRIDRLDLVPTARVVDQLAGSFNLYRPHISSDT